MKKIFLLVAMASLSANQVFANEGVSDYTSSVVKELTTTSKGQRSSMSSEVGMTMSSLADGTNFASVALLGDLEDAIFQFGARGLLPLEFDNDARVFGVEVVSRWVFNRTLNRMYLEGVLTQNLYDEKNSELIQAEHATLGLSYGYFRKVMRDIELGASLGLDYAPTETALSNDKNLNTRLAFLANIDF
jgi:hypothetical protein